MNSRQRLFTVLQGGIHGHVPDPFLKRGQFIAIDNLANFCDRMLAPQIDQNLTFIGPGWISKRKPHQEPIQLGFGKRKCTFVFDRILRCEHQKRTW